RVRKEFARARRVALVALLAEGLEHHRRRGEADARLRREGAGAHRIGLGAGVLLAFLARSAAGRHVDVGDRRGRDVGVAEDDVAVQVVGALIHDAGGAGVAAGRRAVVDVAGLAVRLRALSALGAVVAGAAVGVGEAG